jgi:hypothetical protein
MNLFPFKTSSQRIGSNVPLVNFERGFISKFQVSPENAVAQSNTAVLAAIALTAAAQAITEGITNPPVPRSIKVKGNAAGIAGDVLITGTNYLGVEITETIVLNGSTAVEGTKAFKTVTQIDLPAETNAGTDTVSVGFGNKLGLPYRLSIDSVVAAYRDGSREGTLPTVSTSKTDIELNTALLNSALNGTQIDVLLIV